jgi:hypothetical protein
LLAKFTRSRRLVDSTIVMRGEFMPIVPVFVFVLGIWVYAAGVGRGVVRNDARRGVPFEIALGLLLILGSVGYGIWIHA